MPARPILTAATAVLCLAVHRPEAWGDVLISEVMYNVQGADVEAGVFNKEWIELFNSGDQVVDLGDWSIGDLQDGDFASRFPDRTLLYPNEAMVVTGDAATFDAMWGSGIKRIEVQNFPALANSPSATNETLAIRNAAGVIVDSVNLQQSGGWPRIDGSDGHAISLLPQGLSVAGNDVGANWSPSIMGVYGGWFSDVGDLGENHGSPGFVATEQQSPFAPSPDADWSMVVLPDTQNYVKSTQYRNTLTQMTQWAVDNREAFKIQLVLQEGDIVNNNNTNNPTSGDQVSSQQWANAKASMGVLDGQLPYILAAGNHDYGTTDAQNRLTELNNYFAASDNPLNDPAQGGIMAGQKDPGRLENAYYDFVAPDGRKMLVLSLEWEPRPETVAWANQIAADPQYADHTAVLLTHAYAYGSERRYSGSRVEADADGEELWQDLVSQHGNFELVFNGHFGGDGAGYVGSRGAGGSVHQMFFNTQFQTNAGGGWLRLVEFLEDGRTVRVRTYSPYYDLYRTDHANAFDLAVSLNLAGDFNRDSVVDAADYAIWREAVNTGSLAADANGDLLVDQADYEIWRLNFGRRAAGSTPAAAPEPSTLVLAFTTLTVLGRRRATPPRPGRPIHYARRSAA
ncbi:hypothetical protein Pla123a_10170 [Posidoniimonas polymericola]|uniref:LTD domain-containing protein n=1 Tax=Posidoniimonas polymericola TaxID=2528002 RepID=A0A5C5YUI9_9BACT|nr:lamin tail domain-containing protein [Posidoniimonas polymericola]TWT78227.1 hypothetical protein Pla123a_10170 [Posidoniimonas polymericola]